MNPSCGRALPSWDDARKLAHQAAPAPPATPVPLAEALGAVLSEPLHAMVALPSVDCSAMDGYAVSGAPPWTVVAQVRAGDRALERLLPGTACEIATGAPVPEAALAVLPYEQASRVGEVVSGPIEAGRHIRRAGEQCAAGEWIGCAASVVSPSTLGLAAALGYDTLPVRRGPRVLALVTGDELLEQGLPGDGRVRDAIGPMLPGLIAWAGGRSTGMSRLADCGALLAEAIAAADAEVILVSGSSSKGPADHLRAVLARLGAELLVDGVLCRPGHPQALARLPGERLVIGLPGNPLAAFVAFATLALPAITGLRGLPLPELAVAAPLPAHPESTRLVPVRVRHGKISELPHAGSAMLRSLADADSLAVVTPSGQVRLHPLPR